MTITGLHGSFSNATLRAWQTRPTNINPDCLIYPVFVSEDEACFEEIKSLPGQYRVGLSYLVKYLKPMVDDGLKTILIFPVLKDSSKSEDGSVSLEFVGSAIGTLREKFPTLTIGCDVCLCGYLKSGCCGVIDQKRTGTINYEKTMSLLAEMAAYFARCGCDYVGPSDMMDGRVKAIHEALEKEEKEHFKNGSFSEKIKLRDTVSLMSYSAKFSSAFYGPFRDAAGSSPKTKDNSEQSACVSTNADEIRGKIIYSEFHDARRGYQLPTGAGGLALRAVERDIEEGADIVMVKPGSMYLDIVRMIKDQVSGEYAMLYHAAKHGAFDLKRAVYESLECYHRAGADIIISYYTPHILKWLKEDRSR